MNQLKAKPRRMRVGVDFGPKPLQASWWSPSGRFFVLTVPGHKYWADRLTGFKYGRTQHYLMDTSKAKTYRGFNLKIEMMCRGYEHEGKLSKDVLAAWKAQVAEWEK